MLATAWHAANFSRAKQLPSLHKLLNPLKAKVLSGKELEQRRRERDEMLEGIDLDKINKHVRKQHGDKR